MILTETGAELVTIAGGARNEVYRQHALASILKQGWKVFYPHGELLIEHLPTA